MNKDQLLLEEMYMQMYDEKMGWKPKVLGGLGALGAAGALGYAAMKHDSPEPIKKSGPPQISHSQTHSQPQQSNYKLTFDSARSTKELKNLIRKYYNSQGQDVDVSIMGDNVDLFNRTQNKSFNFPLEELTGAIKMGQDEGDSSKPEKYLDTWI